MKTVNSLSGGKTSAYIAANYKADYNVFALVRTSDRRCLYPDSKMRQKVSDKLGVDFIGTLEDDIIIHTMFDLEQFIGSEINWVTGMSFDDILTHPSNNLLPSTLRRYCTAQMKLEPIFDFWLENIASPCYMNIGFRANEMNRASNVLEKVNHKGLLVQKHIVGKHKNGNNRWEKTEWQKPQFPLIEAAIYKDNIDSFWKDKPVRFAWMNNCVGCFHKNPILLKKMSEKHPAKIEWFADKERDRKLSWDTFRRDGYTYDKIIAHPLQVEIFEDDFSECDSGYCGI